MKNSYFSHRMTKPTKWPVRPAKTQVSLGIRPVWSEKFSLGLRPVWSESSLSAWRKLGQHWVFCNQHPETILHLFYYCEKVKTFWADLKTWLEIKANIILQLTVKNLLFSKQALNVLLNYLLLLAKYHIYRTKFFTNQISMENFIIYVRKKFQNEKYIAKLHNKQDTFSAKWSALFHTLEGSIGS